MASMTYGVGAQAAYPIGTAPADPKGPLGANPSKVEAGSFSLKSFIDCLTHRTFNVVFAVEREEKEEGLQTVLMISKSLKSEGKPSSQVEENGGTLTFSSAASCDVTSGSERKESFTVTVIKPGEFGNQKGNKLALTYKLVQKVLGEGGDPSKTTSKCFLNPGSDLTVGFYGVESEIDDVGSEIVVFKPFFNRSARVEFHFGQLKTAGAKAPDRRSLCLMGRRMDFFGESYFDDTNCPHRDYLPAQAAEASREPAEDPSSEEE